MKLITLYLQEKKSMSERHLNASQFGLIAALARFKDAPLLLLSASVQVDASDSHKRVATRIKRTHRLWSSQAGARAKFARNATCQSGASLARSPHTDGESAGDISY